MVLHFVTFSLSLGTLCIYIIVHACVLTASLCALCYTSDWLLSLGF